MNSFFIISNKKHLLVVIILIFNIISPLLITMGIDLIRGGRIANRGFRNTKTTNTYIKTLIKVTFLLLSCTHSQLEELNPNSIQQSLSVLTNPDLIDILFQSLNQLKYSPQLIRQLIREKINLTQQSQLLSAQSRTILDC